MGLFDIFKSKKKSEFDETMEQMLKVLFPNGEIDIIRDAKERARNNLSKFAFEKHGTKGISFPS